MPRHFANAAGLAVMMLTAAGAGAQPGISPSSLLVPVEPMRGDATPISVSQRILQVDLRQQLGFERAYRVDVRGRAPAAEASLFARKAAAITALFPQSLYEQTPRGPFAAVPPGTVFLIGVADEDLFRVGSNLLGRAMPAAPGGVAAARSPWYADYSAGLSAAGVVSGASAHPGAPMTKDLSAVTQTVDRREPATARTIWSDDLYRRERLAALLDSAAVR